MIKSEAKIIFKKRFYFFIYFCIIKVKISNDNNFFEIENDNHEQIIYDDINLIIKIINITKKKFSFLILLYIL